MEIITNAVSSVDPKVAAAVTVGTATVLAAPVIIPAALATVGFGVGGIGANTVAAGLMSVTWKAQLGMSLVSTAQSVGAAGIALKTATAVGGVAAAACYKVAGYVTGK